MIALKIVKWIICLEKIDFCSAMDAKSVAGFYHSRQFRVGRMSRKRSLAAKTVSKWQPPRSLLSSQISLG